MANDNNELAGMIERLMANQVQMLQMQQDRPMLTPRSGIQSSPQNAPVGGRIRDPRNAAFFGTGPQEPREKPRGATFIPQQPSAQPAMVNEIKPNAFQDTLKAFGNGLLSLMQPQAQQGGSAQPGPAMQPQVPDPFMNTGAFQQMGTPAPAGWNPAGPFEQQQPDQMQPQMQMPPQMQPNMDQTAPVDFNSSPFSRLIGSMASGVGKGVKAAFPYTPFGLIKNHVSIK